MMDPYGNEAALEALAEANVTAFAMELMPRITRAQSMDVLSARPTSPATRRSSTPRPTTAAPSR